MQVEKIHKDAQIPVRANPTDSGADVFAYDFKRKYAITVEMPEHPVVTADGEIMSRPIPVEICIDDKNDDEKILEQDSLTLYPLERALIGTGLKATVGVGHEIQVRPRSGLALKEALTIVNTPGTIDEPYRGEIGIILINVSSVPRTIKKGDKISQLVVAEVVLCDIKEVPKLSDTARGEDGFGSTGK